jgi:hypothetical protein
MTIEVVSFIIGGILVGTAIVGGGFEIKEIKMPRVGAGVRIVSMVVGSGFLLLAMGIWSLNNPQLVANQVPLNNFAPAADTAGTAPAAETQTRSTQVSQPEQPVQEKPVAEEAPVWAQEPASAVFTGFSGTNQLSWHLEGATYYGSINFNGSAGFFRVAFVDPESGAEVQVDQDLVLQHGDGFWWYMGANPRDASTGQALDQTQYVEDNFRVVANGQGGWTIDHVCSAGTCVPVTLQ